MKLKEALHKTNSTTFIVRSLIRLHCCCRSFHFIRFCLTYLLLPPFFEKRFGYSENAISKETIHVGVLLEGYGAG